MNGKKMRQCYMNLVDMCMIQFKMWISWIVSWWTILKNYVFLCMKIMREQT